jgi:acyl carrier protein
MRVVDFDRVAQQLSSLLSIPAAQLTPETTIAELVPDSYMFIEIAVDLQEEYEVVFFQEDFDDLHTLGDLTALLQSRLAASSDT